MSDITFTPAEYEAFLDAYLADLDETSDSEVLEGEDVADLEAKKAVILNAAKIEAGRRRLANARRQLSIPSDVDVPLPEVTPDEARAFIRQARNDPMFTLAAREITEFSDDDALRMYRDMMKLKAKHSDTPP